VRRIRGALSGERLVGEPVGRTARRDWRCQSAPARREPLAPRTAQGWLLALNRAATDLTLEATVRRIEEELSLKTMETSLRRFF
jgi:hypothetical protein